MKTIKRVNFTRLAEIDQKRQRRIATPHLEDLQIGLPFGLYNEPIERLEVSQSLNKIPKWFDPRSNAGHLAVHAQNGECAYLSLTVNNEQRARVHPFDHVISANTVKNVQQLTLLSFLGETK